jgi:Iodothyronine deiodinase
MASCGPLEQLYQTYKDRVTFRLIYIAEAHPGQILAVPTASGGQELRVIPLITTEAERLENLKRLLQLGKLTIPSVIAYPNRLYVISVDGKVVFKGDPGPTGFKVPDLAGWLQENVK